MASLPTTRPGDVIRQFASEVPGDLRLSPARLAAAYRERERQIVPDRRPAPTVMAASREPCPFCHVPGFRGCAHFLPYEPSPVPCLSEGASPPEPERPSVLRGVRGDKKLHPLYGIIAAYCEREGISVRAFGRRLSPPDPELGYRLSQGSCPTNEKVVSVLHYIDDHGGPA